MRHIYLHLETSMLMFVFAGPEKDEKETFSNKQLIYNEIEHIVVF